MNLRKHVFLIHIITLFFPIFKISRSSKDKKHKDEGAQEAEGGGEVDGKQ